VPAAFVTDGFFDVLGMTAALGRARTAAPTNEIVVRERHATQIVGARDPRGAAVSVSDNGYVIAGVMPAEFAFPDEEIELWP